MSNNKYDYIKIPDTIDIRIEEGVKKSLIEKKKNGNKRKKKLGGVVAASLAIVLTLGITSPALASRIPLIGKAFELIETNIHYPGNYSEYATSINETVYSNGIGITLSEVLCDGQSLYVTYVVENEEPFKNTSWGLGNELDMNQLLTIEAYNKADFTKEELDNTGFAGLEGRFIDENTFIGVEKYKLSNLKTDIPDKFTFQTKIIGLENYTVNENSKDYVKSGTWAFKIPVTVNSELRKEIKLNNIEENEVEIKSVSLTPFDMIIDIDYKMGIWSEYRVIAYDESGNSLQLAESTASNDNKSEKIIFESPNKESKNIRIIVVKGQGKMGTYDEASDEVILDKVISLE